MKNTTKEINQKDMEDRPYLYYEDFPTEREGRSDSMQDNYWYLNWKDGTGDMLLWQGSAPIPAPDEVLGRSIDYNLLWCCLAAGILGAVFTLAAWLFRGRRAGKQIRYGALLVGGLCVSIAFASGGQFVSYSGEFGDKMEDAVRILIPMVLAGHFAFKLWDLNHPLPCVEYTREQQEKERRRKRHVYGALTIVLMMYSLAMFTYAALNVGTMYLTADEAIVSVEEQENGDVIIQYSDLFYASANLPARTMDSVEGTLCAGKVKDVLAYRLSKEKPEQTGRGGTMLYSRENMKNTPGVWYLNPKDGTADLKLVSGTVEKPEGPIVEKNHSFALYCALAGACTVLLMLLTRFLPGAGKYLRIGALISASLCLAALCIGGGSFYKFDSRASLGYRVGNSMNVAVPLFLTGLSAMKWKELKK